MPRAFLFDIGNVLCSFDFSPMLTTMRARSQNLAADPFDQFAAVKDAFESGGSTDEEFVAAVCSEIQFDGTHREFIELWNNIFTENPPMTAVVESLAAAGHPLYLLSNTNGLHLDHLRAEFPVFEHFDGGIYSHLANSIKPEEKIYHAAFETYQLDPADTLYIDDLPANIETGNRLGLISHQYDLNDHDAFLDWLEKEKKG